MGEFTTLMARDGREFRAWLSPPPGAPRGVFHLYPGAEHGFSCNERQSYHPASAALARERTLAFLAQHLTRRHPAENTEGGNP